MNPRTEKAKEEYEGKVMTTTDGNAEFVIEKFNSASDIKIRFLESGITMTKSQNQIKKGIPNPFPGNEVLYFSDPYLKYMNTYYWTNEGYLIKVIDYKGTNNVTVQFQDEFGYVFTTTMQNIKKGQVKNPYHKNCFGGFLGEGPYSGNNYLRNIWSNMLVRATGNRKLKYNNLYGEAQQYNDSRLCKQWLCYNTFAHWYVTNIEKLNPNYSYEIDKDLLYPLYKNTTEGYKLYSPVTCVLIPHDLNVMLRSYDDSYIRRSKNADKIVELSERYRNDGAISDKLYNVIRALFYGDGTNLSYINFRGGINYYIDSVGL